MQMVAVLLMLVMFNYIHGETTKPKEYLLDGNEGTLPLSGRLKKPRDPFRRRGFYDAVDDFDDDPEYIRTPPKPEPGEKRILSERAASKGALEDDIPRTTSKTLT